MLNQSIDINLYDYTLPEERIAKFPLEKRDESKLLVYRNGTISHRQFKNLDEVLPCGALLVFNNTKVFRARIIMHKPSGARIEVFCLEPYDPADYERAFAARGKSRWLCMIGNLKKWKEGSLAIDFDYGGQPCQLTAERGEQVGKAHVVSFEWNADCSFGELVEHLGRIPIPPYLNRESEEIDNLRYQTVYSVTEGSVAAPTAGLHFTDELLERLIKEGVETDFVTLHVGAGTFLPVKERDAIRHPMHTEHFSVTAAALDKLIAHEGCTVAVGTTSVRTLESLAALGYRIISSGSPDTDRTVGQWEIYDIPPQITRQQLLGAVADYISSHKLEELKASTQIMITPSYKFRTIDALVTNFHQPKSTLLLLIAAVVGDDWHRIYRYAMDNSFRFLSYGDSSILFC
ncbi:MAG: S-adenosylmethionine:tRNA ribosyltransferase-isomerase [Tidjanibacter sp.]|nr:S-adenosylmethionine:tRNA ribosyltransferase-isomerase [Tidjanibacter sp.]